MTIMTIAVTKKRLPSPNLDLIHPDQLVEVATLISAMEKVKENKMMMSWWWTHHRVIGRLIPRNDGQQGDLSITQLMRAKTTRMIPLLSKTIQLHQERKRLAGVEQLEHRRKRIPPVEEAEEVPKAAVVFPNLNCPFCRIRARPHANHLPSPRERRPPEIVDTATIATMTTTWFQRDETTVTTTMIGGLRNPTALFDRIDVQNLPSQHC
mmetsp:Transcript_6686/g.13024  ORF Transcript_6686/g.13024 Transcript_6686/m.13024 type:complete len:209 (+) Transcript_6686:404-1030(+)